MALGALATPASAMSAKTGFKPAYAAVSPGSINANTTPSASVYVAPFQLVLRTSRAANGGAYICTLDAAKSISILSTPAHASLTRRDLIIAVQRDAFYGDADSGFEVMRLVGTPSATPADPSTSAYPDHVKLGRVTVAAGVTTITSGAITDLRPADLWTVALGGVLPVADDTARDALAPYAGMAIWRLDLKQIEVFDGTSWVRHRWDEPWGVVGGRSYAGSSNLVLAGATSDVALNTSTGAQPTVAGRRYGVRIQAVLHTNTDTWIGVNVRDGITTGSTLLGVTFAACPANCSTMVDGVVEFDSPGSGAHTFGLTGNVSAGVFNWGRPALCYLVDLGPTGKLSAA